MGVIGREIIPASTPSAPAYSADAEAPGALCRNTFGGGNRSFEISESTVTDRSTSAFFVFLSPPPHAN